MKKIVLSILLLFLFVYPKNALAVPSVVTNRPDGTFLFNGQPYFPIGFSPQSLVYNVSETDWQDLKNSGINFTNDGNNPGRFAELNNKLKAQDLNVVIISYGPGHSALDATAQSNLAKNENNFLGYYGFDEPTFDMGGYRSLSPERQAYYQTIFQNDPNHFIWTNHFQYGPWDQWWAQTLLAIVNYNILSRSSVSGADVYAEDWEGVGVRAQAHKDVVGKVIPELQKIRPGINGGVIMIITGYSQNSFQARLGGAVDAIINGANGIVFYFDNADSKIYEWTDYWRLPWLTTPGIWEKWRELSAYNEIKQVASILKEAYPGLTGTINSAVTAGNIRLLAKNGTDGKLYLFAANENASNDVQTGFSGLPAGNYYEITQKQTFSAAQLSSFTFPKHSVRIYVQTTPTRPALCQSATVSKTTLGPGESLTITSTANNSDVKTFSYAFYNLDNLFGPGNPKGIYFISPTIQYVRSDNTTPPVTTHSITVTYDELNKPDLNWNSQKPIKIQVNGYFTNSQGGFSLHNPNCVVKFDITKVDILDLRQLLANFTNIFDYNKIVENFGK